MLKALELENFRNYERLKLEFGREKGLTYLIGDNGQGKTNILEAIYMLALAKSFRVNEEKNLIKWGGEYGRVRGNFEEMEGEAIGPSSLEVFLGLPPQVRRAFRVNDVKVSAGNFVGRVKAVFFHPEDLNMLYLGPDLRRRYLDILILQKSRAYFVALRKFKRLKEQRNALLGQIREGMAAEAELGVWDAQMVREGALLWRERAGALVYIEARLGAKYEEISRKPAKLGVSYVNSLGIDFEMMEMTSNLEEVYAEEMRRSRGRDLASGHTQAGPHRDEVIFRLEGRPIVEHASRGEYRTILLALKLIEMDYLVEDGDGAGRPILLLDDVFSELDHERQKFLLERVSDFQTFITTTKDSAVINQEKLLAGDFVEIAGGGAKKI
jgi:DNA replication and repair protein RecF